MSVPLSLPADTIAFAHKMFEAARNGDLEVLKAAIEHKPKGLPVDLTNDKGNTLLMLASYAGHAALTSYLLSVGASPNRANDFGQYPVAGAVFKGYTDVVRILVDAGADPRAGQPSAVQAAHMFGRKDMMACLGTKEVDRDKEVPENVRPLGQTV